MGLGKKTSIVFKRDWTYALAHSNRPRGNFHLVIIHQNVPYIYTIVASTLVIFYLEIIGERNLDSARPSTTTYLSAQ